MHPELDDLCAEAGFAPLFSTRRSLLPALAPGLALGALLWSFAASRKSAAEWVAPVIGGPELWRLASELPLHADVYAPFDSAGGVFWFGGPRAVRGFFDSRNDCCASDVGQGG